jgi:hypothetical protein
MTDGVQTAEIESRAAIIEAGAKEVAVSNAAEFAVAGEFLLSIKDYRKEVADTFDPIIKAAHATHKAAIAQKKRHDAPATRAEQLVKKRMGSWEQEEERRIEQERREAEAAERKRVEEAQLAAAEAAEAAGDDEKAEQILDAPVPTPHVPKRAAAPPIPGIKRQKRWTFEIVDPALVPREYLKVDEQKIGQVVRAMKAQASIPGVRTFETRGIAAGR